MNNVNQVKIGFIKRAQELNVSKETLAPLVKRADGFIDSLSNAGTQLSTAAGNAGNQLKNFLSNININNPNDAWKTALISGLGGGAIGGIGTALNNMGEPEEDQSSVLVNAIKGLLLGGGLGYAAPHAKNYLDGFKPKPVNNNVTVNNPTAVSPPPLPPAPGNTRENIPVDILGNAAPNPTRGNLTALLSSLIPGGPSLVNREASLGDHLHHFVAKPGIGAELGLLAGAKFGKSPKAKLIGALTGMFGGNMLGQVNYRNDQANKFTDVARNFTPESLIDNKNISSPVRGQLNNALGEGDPSRILDAIRNLSAVAPSKEIPEQFSMVQDMANKEELPGWYSSPSATQNLANIFRKK